MDVINMQDEQKVSESEKKLVRYLSFLEQDSSNTQLMIDTLQLAIALGQFELAGKLIDTHREEHTQDADFNALAGHIELSRGKFQSALAFLIAAKERGSVGSAATLDLVQCYTYLGDYNNGIELFDKNDQLKAEFPEIAMPLHARLLLATDNHPSAIKELEKFHQQYGITAESAGLLSLILFEANEQPELAMQLANDALEKNPAAAEALVARASLYLDASQYDLAQRDINNAIKFHPENGRIWSSKAQVEFAKFNFIEARDAAKNAVTYMSDHIGTWHLLGWAHLMLNELPEALDAFQKSYEIDKRFADTHGGLAAVYAHMNELKMAKNHVKLAQKLDQLGLASVYAEMVILNKENQSEKAKSLFNETKNKFSSRLGNTPQHLVEKRLYELSLDNEQQKTIH